MAPLPTQYEKYAKHPASSVTICVGVVGPTLLAMLRLLPPSLLAVLPTLLRCCAAVADIKAVALTAGADHMREDELYKHTDTLMGLECRDPQLLYAALKVHLRLQQQIDQGLFTSPATLKHAGLVDPWWQLIAASGSRPVRQEPDGYKQRRQQQQQRRLLQGGRHPTEAAAGQAPAAAVRAQAVPAAAAAGSVGNAGLAPWAQESLDLAIFKLRKAVEETATDLGPCSRGTQDYIEKKLRNMDLICVPSWVRACIIKGMEEECWCACL